MVAVKNLWRTLLEEQARNRYGSDQTKSKEWVYKRLQDICNAQLFGIDFNPVLVRACQMNLVMHGGEHEDGAPNIFHGNSLLPSNEWDEEMRKKIRLNSFDIVLTNPPFGAGPDLIVDDPHILDQFELSRFLANTPRTSMPPERLFIERCWQFLKPGGCMAIVLPDSVLSNPGLAYIRQWIIRRSRILASIDLPAETFEAFGGTGTQTSVLVLQKKSEEQMKVEQASGKMEDYEVFMAICKTMGYDRRGNDLWLRTPEGEIIERETVVHVVTRTPEGLIVSKQRKESRPVRDDDVSKVGALFERWLTERTLRGWLNAT